jgi:hypothetical protein
LLVVLERFVEDEEDDEEFAELVEVDVDKKFSEFSDINDDVLIPESIVGLADFLDIDSFDESFGVTFISSTELSL